MTDYFAKFTPSFDAVLAFHKANLAAFVEAQTSLFHGVQEFSKELIAQSQAQVEANVAAAKSVFGAKSIQEAVALQVDSSKVSYEKLNAVSGKLGALAVQVANDAFAPIKARATVATGTLLKPVAA